MRITVRDRVAFSVTSQREITPEGFLRVGDATVAGAVLRQPSLAQFLPCGG